MRPGRPGCGELFECGQGLALVGQPAGLLASERLGGVALGQAEQVTLLAALRRAQVDRPAALLDEERLEVLTVGHGRRHVDLRGIDVARV